MAQPIDSAFGSNNPNQPRTPEIQLIGENGQGAQENGRVIGAMEERLDTRTEGMPRAQEFAQNTGRGAVIDTRA